MVSQLCKEIEGYNYHVYCDNFFTSVSLFESLWSTTCTPVARFGGIARGFPMPSSTSSSHREGNIEPCSVISWLQQCEETRRKL